jgi:hypothetical protein
MVIFTDMMLNSWPKDTHIRDSSASTVELPAVFEVTNGHTR